MGQGKHNPGEPWGGARKGAGRKAELPDGAVRWNVWLEPKHMRFLEKVAKKLGLGGRAPALRHILDYEMSERRATWDNTKKGQ